jgi:cytochrome c biogenesis protein CcmG, thiol:disulfide interchange protein DsbE
MKRLMLMALVGVTLVLVACGEEANKLENHQPAPAFALPDLDGKTLHFPQDLQGQVVALRFWADWCPFCAPEMRDIEPIYREWRDRGLRVLAINVHQDRVTAARFVARLGISYPVLLDEDGALARRYGVTGLPTTFVIDRTGRLHTRIIGEAAPQLFEKIVKELL